MNFFAINTVLAIAWAALTGSFGIVNLIVGFVLGYWALWFIQPLFGGMNQPYFTRVRAGLRLLVFFHVELVLGSLQVIWDILTPQHRSTPRLIEVPLDVESDTEILLVTNLISLTPGTLSVDVSNDRKTLLVHAMFADDPEATCRELKEGMEARVREVFA